MSVFAARMRLVRLLPRAGAGLTAALVVLQLVRSAIPAVQALAVGRLVARLFGGGHPIAAAVLVAGLFLIDQLVWLLIAPVRTLVVKRIDGDLRARLRTLAAGLPTLDVLEGGAFQDRAARVVDAGMGLGWDRSAGSAATGQLELIFRMVSAVAAAVLLATFSVPLAVALLAVALTARAIVRRQWLRIVDKLDADTAGQRYEYYVSSLAVIDAAKDVRLFGLGDWFAGRFRAAAARTYAPVWREMTATLRRQWGPAALSVLAGTAVLAVPAAAVLRGSLDPGRLITFVLAGFGVLAISAMGSEPHDIEYGLRGVQAADELAAAHPAPVRRTIAEAAAEPPVVRFENVVFAYPGSDHRVLDGLTVTLRAGETVAVVGANGVGKTTFVKLLAGLYRPDSGRITVAGVEPGDRRPALAVLFQDFVHYPASLRDNVSFAAPERAADDDAVRAALEQAGAGGLPGDLDASLWREGADGTDLSGGQWQRVALARVLFAAAAGRRLLVLDEPTAHLDVRTEAEFHERVVSKVHDTTTVLISHRLSTVRPADRILLLRDGRVAEDGSHDELIALGGDYARFFATQAGAFR